MNGYNASLYLQNEKEWLDFKKACDVIGKKPNTILRNFIGEYTKEILGEKISLEKQLAKSMVEAKEIAKGKKKAKKAVDLLKEL
jgi:formate-dependent nitrite reductase cytochrome c552 subunit